MAGALACGVISIMVSRIGAEILKQFPHGLKLYEEKWLRGTCGFAAGILFGVNSALWSQAVMADPWSLSILFLCLVLCLLMRWVYEPVQKRYLYGAAFCYGLLLTNSQIHFAFMPAIPFLVAMGNLRVGRDMFLSGFILFLFWATTDIFGILPFRREFGTKFRFIFILLGVLTSLLGVVLVIKTRRAFSEIKIIIICYVCFLFGLSLYFYYPIGSMTDPPMNWAYPRTIEGYFHLITRGQYEEMHPTDNIGRFLGQAWMYLKVTWNAFGWPYLPVVIVPFLYLHRLGKVEQKWILGLSASFIFLAFLMIVVVNPDRAIGSDNGPWSDCAFISSSYVILAVWFGYGLTLLGILLTKRANSRHPD